MIDMEGIFHNPGAKPSELYGKAVKTWLKDIPRPLEIARMIIYEVVYLIFSPIRAGRPDRPEGSHKM